MAHAQVRLVPAPPAPARETLWERIRRDAAELAGREPELEGFLRAAVLDRSGLEEAVVHRVAERLGTGAVPAAAVESAYRDALADSRIGQALRTDVEAIVARDPATGQPLDAVLHLKGYHALVTHRLAHRLWHEGRQGLAKWLQSRASEVFQTDIHPAARIGQGVFLDHATGIVIGETAIVDDDVSILQGVTLGGTGKECGDRHPKIRRGVLIGAGADHPRQHRGRGECARRRRLGGAGPRAPGYHGRGRARQGGGPHRRRGTGQQHGPPLPGRGHLTPGGVGAQTGTTSTATLSFWAPLPRMMPSIGETSA